MSAEARAWETSAKPERMLELHPPGSARKGRLLLAACCRVCWDLLPEGSRHAVEVGERWADDLAGDSERDLVYSQADLDLARAELRHQELANELQVDETSWRGGRVPARIARLHAACDDQTRLLRIAMTARATVSYRLDADEFRRAVRFLEPQVAVMLLRDTFGNPFRPAIFSPEWRTDTAVSLARTMYDSREFGAMPILADAIQDAGCNDTAILDHCRDASLTHVRGCWVVDLVLGKQ